MLVCIILGREPDDSRNRRSGNVDEQFWDGPGEIIPKVARFLIEVVAPELVHLNWMLSIASPAVPTHDAHRGVGQEQVIHEIVSRCPWRTWDGQLVA